MTDQPNPGRAIWRAWMRQRQRFLAVYGQLTDADRATLARAATDYLDATIPGRMSFYAVWAAWDAAATEQIHLPPSARP